MFGRVGGDWWPKQMAGWLVPSLDGMASSNLCLAEWVGIGDPSRWLASSESGWYGIQ